MDAVVTLVMVFKLTDVRVALVNVPVTVVLVGAKSRSHHSGGLLLERLKPFEATNVYPLSLVIRTWSPHWSQVRMSSFPRFAQDPPSVLPSQTPILLKRWLERVKSTSSDHTASAPWNVAVSYVMLVSVVVVAKVVVVTRAQTY
jgi:hypothetical protein